MTTPDTLTEPQSQPGTLTDGRGAISPNQIADFRAQFEAKPLRESVCARCVLAGAIQTGLQDCGLL